MSHKATNKCTKEGKHVGRRSRGEGSIYQRWDGVWVGALDLGWESGKRTRKFVHAATRREVVTGLAEYKRRPGLGQRIDRDEQTVKDFLIRWLAWKEGHIRARTHHGYKRYLERDIYPTLGKKRLVQLRVDDVQTLLDKRKGTMAPQSVKSLRDILRNALNDAVRWGEVERNVAALARIPRQERMRVETLTSKQAAALLKQVEGDRLEALYILPWPPGYDGAKPWGCGGRTSTSRPEHSKSAAVFIARRARGYSWTSPRARRAGARWRFPASRSRRRKLTADAKPPNVSRRGATGRTQDTCH
jgi:hypothetical protein